MIARYVIGCYFAATIAAFADEISVADLANLPQADIVILGELHDQADHHTNQAAAVAAIAPKAIVFEMFGPDAATVWENAAPDTVSLTAALETSGTQWTNFAMYFAIFQAAPDARIYGAALPVDLVRAAIETSAAAQFDGDAALYRLDQPLHPIEQSQRITLQSRAHCDALPPQMLPGMIEAQRLRDASFARTTLQALRDTGGPVVVITGNGHARRDWGIPSYVDVVAPDVSVLSVGQIPSDTSDPQFDLWVATEPEDMANTDIDPCAAFKSN